ncbi:MAG: hypothetical protein FJ333_11560 [Sphingomonadales bacterium]|nr:hypothetical protein [Sphingomonadales bacterium]
MKKCILTISDDFSKFHNKKAKSHFLPISRRIGLILFKSAFTISDNFSQFHHKKAKSHFLPNSRRIGLILFESAFKKAKSHFLTDFQKNWPDFV